MLDLILVSNHVRDIEHVLGLRLENWVKSRRLELSISQFEMNIQSTIFSQIS